MFSEIKIAIKYKTKIMFSVWRCDPMIKDGRGEERIKFAALSGYAYRNEIYFVSIEPKSLSSRQRYHWDSYLAASGVKKDMYTWLSSTYKWYNLWL